MSYIQAQGTYVRTYTGTADYIFYFFLTSMWIIFWKKAGRKFQNIYSLFQFFFSTSYICFDLCTSAQRLPSHHSLPSHYFFTTFSLPLHYLFTTFSLPFHYLSPNSSALLSGIKIRFSIKRIDNSKNYSNSIQFIFFLTTFSLSAN